MLRSAKIKLTVILFCKSKNTLIAPLEKYLSLLIRFIKPVIRNDKIVRISGKLSL